MEGNIKADRIAKLGAEMDDSEALNSPKPPIESLNEVIKDIILIKQQETWLNRSDCKIARTLWPRIDGNRTTLKAQK